tara:strand:- start:114 stop:1343 length:1230 start_codon:yes stop_codon:yes gene_type:complete
MKKLNFENINLFLLSALPVSILIGSTISLATISLLSLASIYLFIRGDLKSFLINKTLILLFIIYIYLILNSLISLNIEIGLARNLGFIRYIFLFLIINFLFKDEKNQKVILKIWYFILLLVLIDAFKEIITGTNFIGYGGLYGNRILSFFKDEPVLAAFLNAFIFIISGYLMTNFKDKNNLNKLLSILSIILFITCVVFTGERSNTLKLFAGILIFCSINKYFKTKNKVNFILIISIVTLFAINSSDYLKLRYYSQIKNLFIGAGGQEHLYFNLYKSGYEVFKKYPFFGVGNKNYRIETCDIKKINENKNYSCSTHPHQIYFEFLSEHGILGSIIVLSIFFFLIFRHLKIIILSKNLIQLGAFSYLICVFLPLLPSGAFFNDFNSTLFWINLSLLYASNKQTNIFLAKK